MIDVLSLILGGGRGARLFPLTRHRSEPAVPIAGKYRLIDIPVSNCINSGLVHVYVLTQYLSASLHRHIANAYKFDPFGRGFVEVLAAQQTNESADWYQGTADAIRKNLPYIEAEGCRDVLILSGDQLYRMDFRQLLQTHRESRADATMAVVPASRERTAGFGTVQVDAEGRIRGFVEKPNEEKQIAEFAAPQAWLKGHGVDATGATFLASMGIYVFRRDALVKLLHEYAAAIDFAHEIFPKCLDAFRYQAHLFTGYWEDLGTICAYHAANLALAGDHPPFDFYSAEGVIYTRMRYLPASRVSDADMDHCLISDGCVVESGARIERCVLGVRSRIGPRSMLRDTVFLGSDRFETEAERAANQARGTPNIGVGEGAVIERAIVDKDCRIGRNARIVNEKKVTMADGPDHHIRDGIVVIPNGVVIPDGRVI